MSTRKWTRPSKTHPGAIDSFYAITRRVKAGTKVTMYEISYPIGGGLDKTETVWTDVIAMLDALEAVHDDLVADGWQREFPEPRKRRKRT